MGAIRHRGDTNQPGQRPRKSPLGPTRTEPGTPKLFGCPYRPSNSKGHQGALWVSLEDIYVSMGLQRVKGCCVLHVYVLTLVGELFNFESSNVKKQLNTFFADLRVFEELLQRFKSVHPLTITTNCHSTMSHNW